LPAPRAIDPAGMATCGLPAFYSMDHKKCDGDHTARY